MALVGHYSDANALTRLTAFDKVLVII